MNFIKATIATAAVTVCCFGNEMPAKASLAASINNFCSSVIQMNNKTGMSAAPGTTGGSAVIRISKVNSATYQELWTLAKSAGGHNCQRMY